MAKRGDRVAHLLEVGPASVAPVQVVLQAGDVPRRQGPIEVVGDQLDQLPAAHLGDLNLGHVEISSASKWRSRAARTLDRARCSSTLWLVSVRPRALHVSAAERPLMSRSVITSRWRGGRL